MPVDSWAKQVWAVTLFAEDLPAVERFFEHAMGLPPHFRDEHSVVFKVGGLIINYLDVAEAADLVAPAPVGGADAGVRAQLTIPVDDVNAIAARLRDAGVELLRGPEQRPWGPTTASFRDPGGHVWEIAS